MEAALLEQVLELRALMEVALHVPGLGRARVLRASMAAGLRELARAETPDSTASTAAE
jgi:hypothetical protein